MARVKGQGTFGQDNSEQRDQKLAIESAEYSLLDAIENIKKARDFGDFDTSIFDTAIKELSDTKIFNLSEQLDEAFDAGKSNISIELDGEAYYFTLEIIEHSEIENKTYVSAENERNQKFVNRLSAQKQIESTKKNGQLYPALGFLSDNGKYEVVDGSQRRFGCLESGSQFKIFISNKAFKKEASNALSKEANTHKELSLWEQGERWEQELADKKYKNAKELAEAHGVKEPIVTAARKAAKFPKWLQDIIPSPADIGRPTINKIDRTLSKLGPKQFEDIQGKARELVDIKNALVRDSKSADQANKDMLDRLFELLELSVKTRGRKRTYQKLSSGGKGKANFKNDRLNIELIDSSDELIEKIKLLLSEHGLEIE